MVEKILLYVFAGLFALTVAGAYLSRARRVALGTAALSAGTAAAAAYFDAFWPMAVLGLLTLVALLAAWEVMDLGWRLRLGTTLAVAGVAFLVMWPSLDTMSRGKIPCPRWVEERVKPRLVAGLDLRGGLRLAYTVEVEEAIKDKRDHYYDDIRVALAKAFDLHKGDERPSEEVFAKLREHVALSAPRKPSNEIRVEFKNPADVAKVDGRFREEFRADLGEPEVDGARLTWRLKQETESGIRERAVAQAKEIILRRVDELGLREASVTTRDEDIVVEVPGEDESAFSQIREIISQTARLEFKMVDDESDFFDQVAAQARAAPGSLPDGLEFLQETAPVGKDEQGARKVRTVTFARLAKKPDETSQQALLRMKEWVATLTPPPDREVGFEIVRTTDEATLKETDAGWRTILLKSRAEVTGDMVRDAAAMPDQSQQSLGGWHVALTFTDQGGRIFDRITEQNVRRRFAILLDGRVESAPEILSRISGGHAQITMGSREPDVQLRDAKKLELVLRSGALPAPISPNNEQRIGPALGQDSIRRGVQGALGGAVLVLIFMVFYYHRAGVVANLCVVLNLFLQLAVMCSFGAAMTLPGIAGLALTVGMAVDANVLINERIREELRAGKTPRTAVEIGYSRAVTAIVDGQLTTVLAGLVMAQYGTGPIKGFAVTLMVGVAVSIFTGVFVSRIFFDWWVRRLPRGAKLSMG